ncbi:GDSL-type esterase/lipase family protein [Streptomyces niveiscabiei]|uniref:GDSL-type esterase/lipase family protein n=1 Tax=Streptomyces niveiscabiei TaxID=164115 RepID=A0ABW9HNJ7_9ACTN
MISTKIKDLLGVRDFLSRRLAVLVTCAVSAAACLAVVTPAAPAAADSDDLSTGSWNMEGQSDGTGGRPETRWHTSIRQIFNRDRVDVLALQEAGNGPPPEATRTDRHFPDRGVQEFIYNIGSSTRPVIVNIYWTDTGQQGNGLAIVTRGEITVRDAVQLPVSGRFNSRPMMGVQIGVRWYFTAHALSNGATSANDAEDIIETARQFIARNAPLDEWMVLADFNNNPARMRPALQQHIVAADAPTHQGGNELDFSYVSDQNQTTSRAVRRGLNGDHFYVHYLLGDGCHAPRAAGVTAAAACGAPVPGALYRAYSASGRYANQVMVHRYSDVFGWTPRVSAARGTSDEQLQVLFSGAPGLYLLKMGDDCVSRNRFFPTDTVWADCDPGDSLVQWAFSGDKIVDPFADEARNLQPVAIADFPDEPYLSSATAAHSWRFESVTDSGVISKREIRLLPLGDSITYGVASSDNNGFRDELYDRLNSTTSSVDFVGSVRAGSMSDPDNEGHPGFRIDEIDPFGACGAERYQPNVVTLHAGTNDMNQNYRLDTAPDRLKDLIDRVLTASPRTTVLVAKLIPTGKPGLQPRIDAYNAAVAQVVRDLQNQDKHVLLVDMSRVLVSDGLENDAHPTDVGYAKMADAWYEGVLDAEAKGWLQRPLPQDTTDPCDATSNPVEQGETALGPGWRKLGVIAPGMQLPSNYDRTEMAEMNGDKRADYVQVRKDGSIRVGINTEDQPGQPRWLNWGGGEGQYAPAGTTDGGATFAPYIRFADIDGNGRDDFLVLIGGNDGRYAMDVWLNLPGSGDRPAWRYIPRVFVPMTNASKTGQVRFADVDGDGRDDLLRLGSGGEVHAYFNRAVAGDRDSVGWKEKLSWAPGVNGANLDNLRFADVNNDNRADYLMVGTDGSMHAFLNNGGKDAGGFDGHLNFANASHYDRRYVQFKDISGDGKADYLVVYDGGAVRAWLNRGGNP